MTVSCSRTLKLIIACLVFAASSYAEDLTLGGVVYKSAAVTQENAAYVKVTHSSGIARIKISELEEEWKHKFGFDAAASEEFLGREAEAKGQRQALEKKKAAEDAVMKKHYLAYGKANQVFDGGILGDITFNKILVLEPGQMIPKGTKFEHKGKTHVVTEEWSCLSRIEDVKDQMVDGKEWTGSVWPNGTYQYTAVSGAIRTVPRYTACFIKAKKLAGLEP